MKTKIHATQQVQSPPQKLHSGQVDGLPPPGVAVVLGVAVLLGVDVLPGVGVFPPHWFGVIVNISVRFWPAQDDGEVIDVVAV